MDYHNIGHYFILNTLINKIDMESNFHIFILCWLVWKLVNSKWIQDYLQREDKNSIIFNVMDRGTNYYRQRPERYLALMDHVRNLTSINQSESVEAARGDDDFSVYEVCQKDIFLMDRDLSIYGKIHKREIEREKDSYNQTKLEIFSCTTPHKNLTEWVEKIYRKWKKEQNTYLEKDTKYIIEIDWIWENQAKGEGRLTHRSTPFSTSVCFENTFFPDKKLLIQELDGFINGQKECKRLGQPWQFGIALTGIKGSGKTRILKCIANYMKRHIVLVSISSGMPVERLINILHGKLPTVKLSCDEFILVFEEIADQTDMLNTRGGEKDEEIVEVISKDDKTLIMEKEMINKRRIFLSKLLPAIDGLIEREGGMIAMTTNFVERLDPALIRPGRIDYHLHMNGGYDCYSTYDTINFHRPEVAENRKPEDIKNKLTGSEIIRLCRTLKKEELIDVFFK